LDKKYEKVILNKADNVLIT